MCCFHSNPCVTTSRVIFVKYWILLNPLFNYSLPWVIWSSAKAHKTTLATWVSYLPKARALQTNDFSFLNFWKSPFQAWDMVILPKLVIYCDVYPLYPAVACLPEVPLSWVPVPWQEHFILMVLGFWIFAKLHSRPEKQVFEHRWAFFTKAIARPPMVQLTWVLFLQLENSQLMILGTGSASKVHSKPDLCAFENVVTKSVTFAPIFVLLWRLPCLTGHNSAHRGAIDPGPFSTAREFPADDFRHWKCLKSPFQAWLIRVQSSHTIWYFWAIFGFTPSFFWFSLFLLPLSRFWLIPFKPPSLVPRSGGYKYYTHMYEGEQASTNVDNSLV